jgi:uncharacterized protein
MTDKRIKSFIKSYSEPILYLLVLLSVSLHKFLGIPNLSIFFLLSPLVFLEIRLLDRWIFLWLFYPVAFLFFDALWLLGMTLSAFAEELFFRAYLMKRYSNLKCFSYVCDPPLYLKPRHPFPAHLLSFPPLWLCLSKNKVLSFC